MRFEIFVKLHAKKSEFIQTPDSATALIKSLPIEGRANKELVRLLSKHFHVPQTSIAIIQGKSSRRKIVEILM